MALEPRMQALQSLVGEPFAVDRRKLANERHDGCIGESRLGSAQVACRG